ncbi:MAG: glycosyltransferase family 2 protein [Chitinophagaceae bacterium]|nr:glycosyltransferase family 2 protein [Chitinophagaceae bacterium]
MFSISIIIPVKNGASTLKKCLMAIEKQQYNGYIETLVLDSASVDNSVEIALLYGAKVINITADEFNHGLTRNEGIAKATGELVYFTVQDAWLADVNNLQIMASHFKDLQVQSVTGIQAIPHDVDKNPSLWFKRSSQPVVEFYQYPKGDFAAFEPLRQKQICCWDNVNAMYRKSALTKLPFEKTNLSEDMIWSKNVLELGWKIVRDPSVVVYHYHHHAFSYSFKLNYMVAFEDRKIFGLKPIYPSVFMPFLKRTYTILKNNSLSFAEKISWIFHNAGIYLAHSLSVFIFRIVLFFGGEKSLEKSIFFFCNTVPQGKQK